MADWFEQLTREGYALLPQVFTGAEVAAARAACAVALSEATAVSSVLASAGGPAYGARNLLRLWPEVVTLLGNLTGPLLRVLGPQGGLTRGLYFDKPPGYSWASPGIGISPSRYGSTVRWDGSAIQRRKRGFHTSKPRSNYSPPC